MARRIAAPIAKNDARKWFELERVPSTVGVIF
jgi:hypothetical protein